MKRLLLIVITVALISCGNDNTQDASIDTSVITNSSSANGKSNEDLPEITFEELEFDFGRITQGERVSHAFVFKNTGRKNLIISGASGSCGCTVPEWPKQPILPGKEGMIDVVFNSEGKSGLQEKTITIVTNCEPATRILKIKTEVIVAETAK